MDRTHHLRHWLDWQESLVAAAAARADCLAGLLAARLLDGPDDPELAALVGLADRLHRDLEHLLLELDAPPTIETRSRRVWGTAA